MTCRDCDKKAVSKGLCSRCYRRMRYATDPNWRKRESDRARKTWSSLTPEQKKAKYTNRSQKARNKITSVVPNACALSFLSQCSQDVVALQQDHDHSCPCNRYAGCSNCFRGLLCKRHNSEVLPILESIKPEFIPERVREYLSSRPLRDTGIEPVKCGKR